MLNQSSAMSVPVRAQPHKSCEGPVTAGLDSVYVLTALYAGGVAVEVVGDQCAAFRLFWRRGNAIWLPQIPACVRTKTSTIRRYAPEKEQA
jgi:hypothetical protein